MRKIWIANWLYVAHGMQSPRFELKNHPDAASRLTPVHQDDLNHPRRLLCMMIRTTSQHSLFPSFHLFLLCKLCKCSSFYLKNTNKNQVQHLDMQQASPQRSLQWTLGLSCWFDAVAEEGPPTKAEPSNSSDPFWKNCVWSTRTERIHWKDAEIRRCWEMYCLHYFRSLFKEKSNAQIWFLGVSRFHLYFWHPKHFRFPCPVVSPACFSAKPRGTWTSLWCFMELFGATWTGEMPKTKTYGSGWVVKVVN